MERFGFIPLNIFYEENECFHKNLPLSRDNLSQIRSLYNKIDKSITEQIDIRWSCRTRLYLNTILELLYEIYVDFLNKNNVDIKSPNSWVSILLEKIHTDYSKNISLSTLSEFVNINKTTVSKYFKEITGFSVTDYIINYRIKCASYALATTDITLNEIAQEYGFSSEAYFIRQFKNKMDMTPSEYRKYICDRRKKELGPKTYNEQAL